MAWTAHKSEDQMQERFESSGDVEQKARTLADWIRNSKHAIVFTGAGVSTSAGECFVRVPYVMRRVLQRVTYVRVDDTQSYMGYAA